MNIDVSLEISQNYFKEPRCTDYFHKDSLMLVSLFCPISYYLPMELFKKLNSKCKCLKAVNIYIFFLHHECIHIKKMKTLVIKGRSEKNKERNKKREKNKEKG